MLLSHVTLRVSLCGSSSTSDNLGRNDVPSATLRQRTAKSDYSPQKVHDHCNEKV